MIKIENVSTMGWQPALRGMRNPLNSWDKADTTFKIGVNTWSIGSNDLQLAMKLRNAGRDHRKFMRMIICYADITAPLYWWKEFDTYRNGVEKNSCSTMHKIAAKAFTVNDFSTEHLFPSIAESQCAESEDVMKEMVCFLNLYREKYLKTKEKKYWWQMIQLLPSSYNQRRTVMMSYETLANIYQARKNHKLDEWKTFCKWIEELPYAELITG